MESNAKSVNNANTAPILDAPTIQTSHEDSPIDSNAGSQMSSVATDPPRPDSASSRSVTLAESGTAQPVGTLNGVSENKALDDLNDAVDAIDENLDQAIGHAADSIWNFASAVTGTVSNVVKERQPGLDNLRKNVTSRFAPLDTFGRDLSTQIGALAPNEASLSKWTGSMKSVAESVQRNAEAMEAAILAKANGLEKDHFVRADPGKPLTQEENSGIAMSDPAVGLLAIGGRKSAEDDEENIDVNEEIAKVGESIQNSLLGQTVGDLWTGLWGRGGDADADGRQVEINMPKTRFEKRIHELQANPDTYCEPAEDLDAFEKWSKSFVLEAHADSCIAILDTHDNIAELYERVVPRIVDEDTFWMRYFFARHILEEEEEKRKRLLERAEHAVTETGGDDDGWGDDDWDDDVDDKGQKQQAEDTATSMVVGANSSNATEPKGDAEPRQKKTQPLDSSPMSNILQKTSGDDWGDDDWE